MTEVLGWAIPVAVIGIAAVLSGAIYYACCISRKRKPPSSPSPQYPTKKRSSSRHSHARSGSNQSIHKHSKTTKTLMSWVTLKNSPFSKDVKTPNGIGPGHVCFNEGKSHKHLSAFSDTESYISGLSTLRPKKSILKSHHSSAENTPAVTDISDVDSAVDPLHSPLDKNRNSIKAVRMGGDEGDSRLWRGAGMHPGASPADTRQPLNPTDLKKPTSNGSVRYTVATEMNGDLSSCNDYSSASNYNHTVPAPDQRRSKSSGRRRRRASSLSSGDNSRSSDKNGSGGGGRQLSSRNGPHRSSASRRRERARERGGYVNRSMEKDAADSAMKGGDSSAAPATGRPYSSLGKSSRKPQWDGLADYYRPGFHGSPTKPDKTSLEPDESLNTATQFRMENERAQTLAYEAKMPVQRHQKPNRLITESFGEQPLISNGYGIAQPANGSISPVRPRSPSKYLAVDDHRRHSAKGLTVDAAVPIQRCTPV